MVPFAVEIYISIPVLFGTIFLRVVNPQVQGVQVRRLIFWLNINIKASACVPSCMVRLVSLLSIFLSMDGATPSKSD